MTAKPERFQAALFGDEATFAEASPTIDTRVEFFSQISLDGLDVEMIDASFVDQYASGGYRVLQGPRNGSFSITIPLTGHGSDPGSGTLTATALYTLLRYVLGGGHASNDGGVISGGTAGSPTHTGAVVANDTGLLIGTLGDGVGNGQAYFASGESGGTITLMQALAGAGTNEAIRAMLQVFPIELPASAADITSTAWRLQTANRQYDLHGCYPTGISFEGLNARERPSVTITFGVAWWEIVNQTFPTATSISAEDPAVVMNGSLVLDSGATHTEYNVRSFSINLNYMHYPQESASADNEYQVITGCKHGGCVAEVDVVVDALASGTTTHWDDFTAENSMRLMYTLSGGVPGKAVAFFFPNLAFRAKPVQSSSNGLNTEILKFRAKPQTSGTTDRELASWHLLMG